MLNPRAFGQTDLKLSPIGLGTVKFGRNQGVKYPYGFELPSSQALSELLSLARNLGINVLDTAPAYGESESRLGKLLTGQRDNWILMSKVGEQFKQGQSLFDFSPLAAKQSVENSLTRLNTDYLDFLMIHSDGHDLDILHSPLLDTLATLKTQGKIRYFGISTKTVPGGLEALQCCDAVMCTYHPGYTAEKPILDQAAKLHKGIFIKKAMASGHLEQLGANPIHASFKLSLSHPCQPCIITGTIHPEHLEENCTIAAEILNPL